MGDEMHVQMRKESLTDIAALALLCSAYDMNEVDFDIENLHVHIEFSMNEEEGEMNDQSNYLV
jgi:hypothetical protein